MSFYSENLFNPKDEQQKSLAERFLPAIQVFAALFGKIMPFWMAAKLGIPRNSLWIDENKLFKELSPARS